MRPLQPSTDADSALFPALDPFDSGWLQVSPLHHIYYEQCGNPQGAPVVFLHGGPGSGCNPKQRCFFDPSHYRVILFDQRGCGRSKPMGCVTDNTTDRLISDMEALRNHLRLDRWLVFGGSWGSTLALTYALEHATRVTALILRGIFLARPEEMDWFIYKVKKFFPETYSQLVAPLAHEERSDILRAYEKRIFSNDPAIHLPAARNWNTYEASILQLLPDTKPSVEIPDDISLARARVQLHYLVNDCFLHQPLLDEIHRLNDIPCKIIQGRYDMVCPPETAYELHQAWPEAEFVMVHDAGHWAMKPGISAALVDATESFKAFSL